MQRVFYLKEMKIKFLFGFFLMALSSFAFGQKIMGLSFVGTKEKVLSEQIIPVQEVGANWVTLMPFGYMQSAADSMLRYDTSWQWEGEKTKGLHATIPLFKAKGIKVMLKPQIWISKGVYTGKINPKTPQAWKAFKTSYRKFILHFAGVAAQHNLPLFCIGTELPSMIKQEEKFWRELILEIRTVYKGKLVYAENWDQYQVVPFWDALDYIGINAYFPLNGKRPVTLEDMRTRWTQTKKGIAQMTKKLNRPVIFTEMGYRSIDDPLSRPWDYSDKAQKYNPKMQAMALEALLLEFMPQPWWKGGFVWKWFPNHATAGGENHMGFTPQNKLAEEVLRTYFTKRE